MIIAPHIHGRTDAGYLIPTEIVLVLLAIPPILANTYAGVQNVDPAVRDAARGMGMTGAQVLRQVELPERAAADLLRAAQRDAAGHRHRHHRRLRRRSAASAASSTTAWPSRTSRR